jgi:hypothetical protein
VRGFKRFEEDLLMRIADVLIIDTENDLNVYIDTNEDGTRKGEGDKKECCGKSASELASGNTIAGCECCQPVVKTTGEPSKLAGCCLRETNGGKPVDGVVLRDLNLNEWAGKFKFNIVEYLKVADTYSSRVL